ncbi:hypothetical protein HMSSN036_79300 [Paenibacillus macerans]|nr:hypothetical protein HMSSN036_79300 [Paenibacillus macerans]
MARRLPRRRNGWQFGDGYEADDPAEADRHDGEALYDTLLNRVLPAYYGDRTQWVRIMQRSIETIRQSFSTGRMLEEYYRKMYIRN